MGEQQADSDRGTTEVQPLCDAYRALDMQRLDIDQRLTALPADAVARDMLWDELEAVMAKLGGTVDRLAASPARKMAEIRAKANVLATLLRPGDAGGPLIPERSTTALALSLINDLAGLPG